MHALFPRNREREGQIFLKPTITRFELIIFCLPPLSSAPSLANQIYLAREIGVFFGAAPSAQSGYLSFASISKTPHLFSFYLAGNEEVAPLKSNNPNKKTRTARWQKHFLGKGRKRREGKLDLAFFFSPFPSFSNVYRWQTHRSIVGREGTKIKLQSAQSNTRCSDDGDGDNDNDPCTRKKWT